MAERLLRVFTHPACSGCGPAVRLVWELAGTRKDLALRTVSLDNKEGLDEAHAAEVRTIPTVILTDGGVELARWVGMPARSALAEKLEALP